MIEKLRITTLVDNIIDRSGLFAEHGLSFWIEADDHRILFDTGQQNVLCSNAEKLGIDLRTTQRLVLSHGHYDHTGGIHDVLKLTGGCPIYLHPAAMDERYAKEQKPPHRRIGLRQRDRDAIESHSESLIRTADPHEIVPNVWVTGQVPRNTDYEDTGGPFFLDEACTIPDPILDDQALYIRTPQGTVVVLGCAHSGVVNTLDSIRELTDDAPIRAVLGGMHLVRASQKRLNATGEALESLAIETLLPGHCTGTLGIHYLMNRFPGHCDANRVGRVFSLGL